MSEQLMAVVDRTLTGGAGAPFPTSPGVARAALQLTTQRCLGRVGQSW
jgi:hypothetical protein